MSQVDGSIERKIKESGIDAFGEFEIVEYIRKTSCDCDSPCNCDWWKTKLSEKKEYKNGKTIIIWEKK